MADKPKPFLKKGQGKHTKIDYPVLRRSGAFQPSLATSNKSFGSSQERRIGESDEGVVRDSSPGLLSSRPRTAGTIDSGFPREELPQLSPASSSGETRASSFPSMVDDLTSLQRHSNGEKEEASLVGNTTQEFERREQQALERDKRDAATPLTIHSSLSSSSSSNDIRTDLRQLMKAVGEDEGEEVFGRMEIPLPQRMMDLRLDESVAADVPVLSPIGSQTRAKSVEDFEGASFRESHDSRQESTSHFRIHDHSREEYPATGDESRREESKSRTTDEITLTQQRPSHHRIRASQATLRNPPIEIHQELLYGEKEQAVIIPSRGIDDGNGETKINMNEFLRMQAQLAEDQKLVQMMADQCRDAIAHIDMADAALRRQIMEHREAVESIQLRFQAMADANVEREQEREEEMKRKMERLEQMKSELEKEKRLPRKDDASKVNEWRTKFEEEQMKRTEDKTKYATEVSKGRVREANLKKELEAVTVKMKSFETDYERIKKIVEKTQREQAIARGNSAIRNAMARVEDEAPVKNELMGRRASMNSLVDKENVPPPPPSSSDPSALVAPPQGILKKNQVRFADTSSTLDPTDETLYEIERGNSEWGPYSVYAINYGGTVAVSRPLCCRPCAVFKYDNGDLRMFNSDTSAVFHYFEDNGAVGFDFPKERCKVFYFADGTLEIWRTGRNVTICKSRVGNIDRKERITREDGGYYTEIWNNNSMAIYDGEMGKSKVRFDKDSPINQSSHRESEFGTSHVTLHMSNNLEFFEPNFYAVYYAATGNFKLVVNFNMANEIKYELRPSRSCEIVHVNESKETMCIAFGPRHRKRIDEA